ncbi:MAG: LPXTG cell wall anchor domain-containing protein [Chloroflexi bacterium]|nr:LPXTG cell wall anchor domain-containing protein [Chloroflexota bacterium]
MKRLIPLILCVLFLATTVGVLAQAGSTVLVKDDAKLGKFLTDSKGVSLYLYKNDKPNETVCYDACATAWPPLIITGTVTLPAGVTGKIDVIKRKEGTNQVTYNGIPLYYYVQDKAVGDVTGQGKGNVWYVVAPDAVATTALGAAAPAAAPAPAKLPTTGDSDLPYGVTILGGLALLGAGVWLRRRQTV